MQLFAREIHLLNPLLGHFQTAELISVWEQTVHLILEVGLNTSNADYVGFSPCLGYTLGYVKV
jgi:hypothetical protein